MDRSDYNFFSSVPTRWGDTDMLGHINNVIYVRYLESGRLDYLNRIMGISFKQIQGSGVILADMKISYLRQVHHPASLQVATRVSRIGNTSFDIIASIYDDANIALVKSSAVCVWYDYAKDHKQPVPLPVRDAVFNYEAVKPLRKPLLRTAIDKLNTTESPSWQQF